MKEEVEKYLEKAEASLGVARNLFDDEYYADACSKAYYVMYYREVADYDVFSIIDRNIAKEMIKWAEDFLNEIKKLAVDTILPTTS